MIDSDLLARCESSPGWAADEIERLRSRERERVMREEKLGPVNTSGMTGISVVIEPSTAEKLIITGVEGHYYRREEWLDAVRRDILRRRRRRLLRWILKKTALALAFFVAVLLLAWAAIAIRPTAAHAVTAIPAPEIDSALMLAVVVAVVVGLAAVRERRR